jgi:hypothetical protein
MDAMLEQVSRYQLPFTVTRYRMPESERGDFIKHRTKGAKENIKYLNDEQIEKLRSLGYIQ